MNNNRLTESSSIWDCKIKECVAEDWMSEITGIPFSDWKSDKTVCTNCPFEKYINKLSFFEDMCERIEDDLR